MKRSATSTGRSRAVALAWGAFVALVAVWLALLAARGLRVETSVLRMLPVDERDATLHALSAQLQGRTARTLVVLVGHADPEQSIRTAGEVHAALITSGAFESVEGRIDDARAAAFSDLYFPLRYQMLTPKLRAELQAGAGADQSAERVLDVLLGPLSSMVGATLVRDPLLLHFELVRSWADGGVGAVSGGGFITVADESKTYALMSAVVAADPFDASGQREALLCLEEMAGRLSARGDTSELVYSGVARHAVDARERMQGEMTWLGALSTIGTLLCTWIVLRSWRSIGCSLLPMAVSILAGTWACFVVFPEVHVLTLILGTTLTGMGVDYALHYFFVHRDAGEDWDAERGMRAVMPGITVGMLTSVVGFSGLYFTSFPVLRQFALFSSIGLAAAWATVVAWYPPLSRAPRREPRAAWFTRACGLLLTIWERRRRRRGVRAAMILAGLASIASIVWLPFEDDIRALHEMPAELAAADARVRSIAGHTDDSRFVLVEGATEEEALRNLEDAQDRLESARSRGALLGTISLSPFLPSRQRQERDHEVLASALGRQAEALRASLEEIGFTEAAIAGVLAGLTEPPTTWLDVRAFLDSPASASLRTLWLGSTERGTATTILLRGIADGNAVEQELAGLPGVHYVDRVRDLSALMRRHRIATLQLLGCAYVAVLAVLLLRFGVGAGIRVMLPAVIAAGGALALLAACGVDLSVFHALGLLLVLGLAVDYGAFLAESGVRGSTTMQALALTTATTVVAFGAMTLSSAPPLRAIGGSVALGISLALLLAPSAWREESIR